MKRINLVLLALTSAFAAALHAQTADEIIAKHIEAIGGKEKLAQVKSLYTENTVDVMGNATPQKEHTLDGKGFRSETEFNGSKIISCFNDKGGWNVNPMTGVAEAQPMPEGIYKAGKSQIYIGGALLDYASKGNTVELVGKDGNNYKLKVIGGGVESEYYIDPSTYYLVKTLTRGEMMGQTVEVVTTFSDYKKTDFGIVLPYSKAVDFGGFAVSSKADKVEINKEMDPKIFDQP